MKKSKLPEGAIFNAWVRDGCPASPAGFWSASWESQVQVELAKKAGGAPPKKVTITKKTHVATTGALNAAPVGSPLADIQGFNLNKLKKTTPNEAAPAPAAANPANPLAAINGFDMSMLKKVDRTQPPATAAAAPRPPMNPLEELKMFNKSKLRSSSQPVKQSEAEKAAVAAKTGTAGGFKDVFSNALDNIRQAVGSDSDEDDEDWDDNDDWAM